MTHKSEENSSARNSISRDEDFSCSLNFLYGGQGISFFLNLYFRNTVTVTINDIYRDKAGVNDDISNFRIKRQAQSYL
jgi:hypothetical protein